MTSYYTGSHKIVKSSVDYASCCLTVTGIALFKIRNNDVVWICKFSIYKTRKQVQYLKHIDSVFIIAPV